MPPRKKAAAAALATIDSTTTTDTTTPAATRSTRSGARVRDAASGAASVDPPSLSAAAVPSKPAPKSQAKPSSKSSKAKAPVSKTNNKGKKRARDNDDDNDGDDEPQAKRTKELDIVDEAEEKDEETEAQKNMITVIKRGAAPVDTLSGKVDTHQVLTNDEGVWDAMLNQTDVGKNANKYYVIQILHPIGDPSICELYTRWGRVGEDGQRQTKGSFSSEAAVSQFKSQFRKKASVAWEKRHNSVAKPGSYQWIERSFDDNDNKDVSSDSKAKNKQEEQEKVPDSNLKKELQELCQLIFSTKLMAAHLTAMNYDANKLPLGKLAKSTILNGFAALKALSEVLTDPNCDTAKEYGGVGSAITQLTGRYYSIIPHVFGRNRPPLIDDMTVLKRELELVDALGDMEVASKLISDSVDKDENGELINPMDAHFRGLRLTSMDPIPRKSTEFSTLETYLHNTHGATHHIKVNILNAFRVERQEETDAWINAGHDRLGDGERLLLWHGSRTTNFAGILKQGLRIAPPEAPVTGYMFGKGVYFADMMSKSANYCYAHLSHNTGLLLLCEVAAKPFLEQQGGNYNADQDCKAASARATKGLGTTQPAEWQDAGNALSNPELKGVHMPKGLPANVDGQNLWLQYNEYIVYDISQIRLRYLLMVKMR